ncbi:hypothetical protein BG000_004819 [Podila horticola]|nr:hypothetical protein BG000_004819 [Podila horticola]
MIGNNNINNSNSVINNSNSTIITNNTNNRVKCMSRPPSQRPISRVPSHAIFQPDGTAFDEGQICSNDPYGATALSSLALVLDGHLKLLDDDDMDMMHNMGEYEDLLSYISSPTPQ